MSILPDLLNRFLAAGSWDEARDLLEAHPELLGDEFLALLAAESERHRGEASSLKEERRFLLECRQIGIAAAFCERMIVACEGDLAEISFDADPASWVGLTLQLAGSYAERSIGDRRENLERALAAYERALERFSYEDGPESWIGIMNNRALLYTERIAGRREDNVEKAIATYREILDRGTEVPPETRANVLNNLGKALCDRPGGDRLRDLAEAAERFQEAVEIYAQEEMWEDWAEVLTNLGTIHLEPPAGGPEDLTRAIELFRKALTVLSFQSNPQTWARTLINLGNAHRERSHSGRSRDVEVAIRLYRRVLRKLPRERFPSEWGTAQLNLAIAWIDRRAGNRGESLERALKACESGLAAYEKALEALTREDDPLEWSGVKSNLASACLDHFSGDREETLERALAACQDALEVRTRRSAPMDWAGTLNTLGLIYSRRFRGARAENRARAVAAFREAFQVVTAESLPVDFRRLQRNLGNLCRRELEGGDGSLCRGAAGCRASLPERSDPGGTELRVGREPQAGAVGRLLPGEDGRGLEGRGAAGALEDAVAGRGLVAQ